MFTRPVPYIHISEQNPPPVLAAITCSVRKSVFYATISSYRGYNERVGENMIAQNLKEYIHTFTHVRSDSTHKEWKLVTNEHDQGFHSVVVWSDDHRHSFCSARIAPAESFFMPDPDSLSWHRSHIYWPG
jgi:hypothetical protein